MSLNGEKQMRVLAVTSYLPSPLDRGDPVRVDMYLRALNDISNLTVLATEREDTTKADIDDLENRLPGARVLTFPPASTAPARRLGAVRWALAVLTLTPSWVANRASPRIAKFLSANAKDYDYCFLLGEASGQYAPIRINTEVHWDKSNVLTASTKGDVSEVPLWSLARIRLELISRLSRRFETRVLSNVEQVSVTSLSEAERLRELLGRTPDFVHPSAIEPIPPSFETCSDSKTILWMGSFQYHSNINGLTRFLDSGLPILRSSGYKLRIVGSGASPDYAEKLRLTPGVEYLGFVPDLADAVRGVKAAVIPLWSGAGVKIKTLTLMGLGVPIVGTQTAFEGIDPQASLGLAESPEVMAQMCADANNLDLSAAQKRAYEELEATFTEERFFTRVAAQMRRS